MIEPSVALRCMTAHSFIHWPFVAEHIECEIQGPLINIYEGTPGRGNKVIIKKILFAHHTLKPPPYVRGNIFATFTDKMFTEKKRGAEKKRKK